MNVSTTDCRTDTGVTVGLIDAIIAISRILQQRDLAIPEVREALLDLAGDESLNWLLEQAARQ